MISERALPGLRAFQPDDLPRVLEFFGTCCAVTNFSDGFHPGAPVYRVCGETIAAHIADFVTKETSP